MRKITLFFVAALLIVSVVLSAGCTSTDPIVGQWTLNLGDNSETTTIFYADGTGYTTDSVLGQHGDTTEFKWVKKDGKYYTATNSGIDPHVSAEISGDGKKLILSSDTLPIAITYNKISDSVPAEKPKVSIS